jgi:3',5'-cyclic AMP phosphodiesterase CpdA
MLIAQISDLHVAEDGHGMRRFVDANTMLAAALDYLEGLEQRPDVVVATGDLTDNGRPEQYELLVELLDRTALPVYLIPGNHDEREPFRAAFGSLAYVPSQGPIQYVVEDHPVRLVAVDTLRDGHHDGELDDERLSWLDETLAARADVPTVVFMHHPPFTTGIWWMDCIGLTGARRFEAVVRRHEHVRMVLCGHLHRPIQTMWGTTLVSTAPSTAHQTQCNLHPEHRPVVAAEAPMVQLHWWNGDTFVSHTTPFLPPTDRIDIASVVSDWPSAQARIKQGPPFAKGGLLG